MNGLMSWISLLSRGDYQRLMEWAFFARQTCGTTPSFFCADISQTVGFLGHSGLSAVVPAILRNSKIMICGPSEAWRPAVPEELLAAQGFPVFAEGVDVTPVTKSLLSLLEKGIVSQKQAIGMIGNGMHHAAVGSVILHLLLSLARV